MGQPISRPLAAALLVLAMGAPQAAGQTAVRDSSTLTIEASLSTGSYGVAAGFGSIWSMQSNALLRIDPADNSVTTIPVPEARGGVRTIAMGEGGVWLPDGASGMIFKVDPESNAVVLSIAAGLVEKSEATIGVGAGSIWVMSVGEGKAWLARYSAGTGKEEARIPMRANGLSVIFAEGSAWVSGTYRNEVYRIDPATNAVVATIKMAGGPRQLAAGEGAIWVQSPGEGGLLHRIDPATNTVVASIATASTADNFGSVAAGGGFVWMSERDGLLQQIDPASNAIVSRYEGKDVTGYVITYAEGSLWLSGYGSTIYRIVPPAP